MNAKVIAVLAAIALPDAMGAQAPLPSATVAGVWVGETASPWGGGRMSVRFVLAESTGVITGTWSAVMLKTGGVLAREGGQRVWGMVRGALFDSTLSVVLDGGVVGSGTERRLFEAVVRDGKIVGALYRDEKASDSLTLARAPR